MFMGYMRPSMCSGCGELYVNRGLNTLVGAVSGFVLGIVIFVPLAYFKVPESTAVIAILLGLPFTIVAYGIFAHPVPYVEPKKYSPRAWWEIPIIYGVLPFALVIFSMHLLVSYGDNVRAAVRESRDVISGGFILLIAASLAVLVRSRRQVHAPPRRSAKFHPDPRNDKVIVVSGWTEEELERMISDFVRESFISTSFKVTRVPREGLTYQIVFPEDIPPKLFLSFVNYLNYPLNLVYNGRAINVIGKTTLSSAFDVPDQSLVGARAIVQVPDNDDEFDVVHIQIDSGPTYRWAFSESEWVPVNTRAREK